MKPRFFFSLLVKIFIPVFFIFLSFCSASAEYLSKYGIIDEDETWSGEILVTGDVVVLENATLRILPGTKVEFSTGISNFDGIPYMFPGYSGTDNEFQEVMLGIRGRLLAEGRKDNPITFTSNAAVPQRGDWEGIYLYVSANSTIKHCIIEYGEDVINTSGLTPTNNLIEIHNNIIRYSEEGILIAEAANLDIQYNTIYENWEGVEYHKSLKNICKEVTLKNNIIVYNSKIGINNNSRGCSYTTSNNDVWSNARNYDTDDGIIDKTRDISINPFFVSYPYDVHLQAHSSCKTASDQNKEIGYYGNSSVVTPPDTTPSLPTNRALPAIVGLVFVPEEVQTVTSAGQVWMDRNLGASRIATSSTDSEAYGDLYQWGRGTDGHEKRTSSTISTNSTTDTPGHDSFITESSSPYDWRTPQNDNLWQGVSGTNNPCPSGFRLPTATELDIERISWSSNISVGAFASPTKLVAAGFRNYDDGSVTHEGSSGLVWSSTVLGSNNRYLAFNNNVADIPSNFRAYGFSVRCFKD